MAGIIDNDPSTGRRVPTFRLGVGSHRARRTRWPSSHVRCRAPTGRSARSGNTPWMSHRHRRDGLLHVGRDLQPASRRSATGHLRGARRDATTRAGGFSLHAAGTAHVPQRWLRVALRVVLRSRLSRTHLARCRRAHFVGRHRALRSRGQADAREPRQRAALAVRSFRRDRRQLAASTT